MKNFLLGCHDESRLASAWEEKEAPCQEISSKDQCVGRMKSQLYFFKKNMDAPLYQTVVKRRLRNDRITFAPDAPARLPTSYQFLQDNAPWHTCDDSMSE